MEKKVLKTGSKVLKKDPSKKRQTIKTLQENIACLQKIIIDHERTTVDLRNTIDSCSRDASTFSTIAMISCEMILADPANKLTLWNMVNILFNEVRISGAYGDHVHMVQGLIERVLGEATERAVHELVSRYVRDHVIKMHNTR